MEIAESLEGVFQGEPLSREQIVSKAEQAAAPQGVVGAIEGLPEGKRFNTLRDLWPHLYHLPVKPGA
jgi:hypothetical protein